jgi:uncharacterized protein
MSGLQMTTENTNNAFSVDAIIKQIKESQENVLKAFEEHNNLVNKSLEIIQQLKTETKVEVVKVKDPLEEIKILNDIIDKDVYNHTYTICGVLINIFLNILSLYGKDKISSSFKVIFLNIFKKCLEDNKPENINEISSHFKGVIKKEFLKVRDIRWLLLEMEKYPQYFQFTEDDLNVMKENGASRDNIYLVKKFLKKDGDYEEYYPEEEGGGIKCKYHMTGGHLNGEYKEYYPDGNIKQETIYKKGLKDGYERVFMNNGDRVMESEYKEDKLHGEHKRYFQNRLILHSHYKNGALHGEYKGFNMMSGNLEEHCFYKDNKLDGEYIRYYDDGNIHIKTYYLEGELEGENISYNNDKTIASKFNYKNGKREGLQYFYLSNGNLGNKYTCKSGKEDGKFYSWYPSGKIWVESEYLEGKLHGIFKRYYENGNQEVEYMYSYGDLNGLCKKWDKEGNLVKEETITEGLSEITGGKIKKTYLEGNHYFRFQRWNHNDNIAEDRYSLYGKNHGLCKIGYGNGVNSSEVNYKNGIKDGECIIRCESGNLWGKSFYIEGLKHGLSETWYHDSETTIKEQLKEQANYNYGEKDGEYKSWWKNGNKRIQTTYKNDKIHGEYFEWNEDGTLKEKTVYKDGVKV